MRNIKLAASIGGALLLGLVLSGASPPPMPETMPAVGAGHIQIDQLKVLSDRVQRLETTDAQKNAQIASLSAQLAKQSAEIVTLQAAVATVQSQGASYVPAAGPGNCASHGYMNGATLMSSPNTLVYTWGTCKAP